MTRTAWQGWGPVQPQTTNRGFGGRHKVAGWDWDEPLNGYITHARKKFACDCGEEVDVPEFKNCKCGKIWYTYAIGSGGDMRTASPELFLARQIEPRKDVILSSKQHKADNEVDDFLREIHERGDQSSDENGQCSLCGGTRGNHARECPSCHSPERQHHAAAPWEVPENSWQGQFAADIADGYPENAERARYVNYLNRWRDMRNNEHGGYDPNQFVDRSNWDQQQRAAAREMYWPSAEEDDRDSQEWQRHLREPGGQGPCAHDHADCHERDLRAARRLLAEADSSDAVLADFDNWLYTQGDSLENLKRDPSALEAKLREFMGGANDPRVYEVMDRVAYRGTPKYSPEYLYRLKEQFAPGKGFQGAKPYEWPEEDEEQERRNPSPLADRFIKQHEFHPHDEGWERAAVAWHSPVTPWSGKTPGGPAGSGTEGLKQHTKYHDYGTPQLRQLRDQALTGTADTDMMNELLRELSFREVMSAIHDLSAPGGTPSGDGKKTKRTDPQLTTPTDWHRRDNQGRWQRGDGHPMKAAS